MPAILFSVGIALLAAFQLALALGAPLGAYAWGGQHDGSLPKKLRLGSLVSILVYALLALILLSKAGVIELFPMSFAVPAAWVVFAYMALGTLLNLISRSRKERAVMTPIAATLAIFALLVAL
ncbi:hypothetical protein QBL02_08825 [Leucobacter sp. UT-8R-CII-1-4]|uniref:hypothetical protein n=1 Tax=Leucobacter sp. UT-8R-CII-1-4 TaxID=3040075 RepID=UPI0024A8FEA8|nr:hypothetical protein [Leucobacter sp. UT-8R-CII-1-4]MDI6023647.1 hypothetical protein [Leucobacter sp. UT-8R-CII-1-4]